MLQWPSLVKQNISKVQDWPNISGDKSGGIFKYIHGL